MADQKNQYEIMVSTPKKMAEQTKKSVYPKIEPIGDPHKMLAASAQKEKKITHEI